MGRAILILLAVLIAAPIWLFKRVFAASSIKPDFGDVVEEVMVRFAVVSQSLDDRWEVAKASAGEGGRGTRIADIHQQFSIFLAFVGAPPDQSTASEILNTEELKRRYMYFVLGAAHCLAENSPDEKKAGEFFRSIANDTSTALFGKGQGEEEFQRFLENAARESPEPAYFVAVTENGYSALKSYMHGIEGFRPDTVGYIVRQKFRDSVFGPESSADHAAPDE